MKDSTKKKLERVAELMQEIILVADKRREDRILVSKTEAENVLSGLQSALKEYDKTYSVKERIISALRDSDIDPLILEKNDIYNDPHTNAIVTRHHEKCLLEGQDIVFDFTKDKLYNIKIV